MQIKQGDTVDVDGRPHEVFHGPWRYETSKSAKTGYGLYVLFEDVERERDVWRRRCGVEVLEHFGFSLETV